MTPSEEEIVFYKEIGFALTQWAHVEGALRDIVISSLKNALNRHAVSVGFFSIDAFRAKMDFAEATMNRTLAGTPHRQDWTGLVDRAKRASRQRNKLAHWRVAYYELSMPGRRFALEPWVIPKKKKKTKVPIPRTGALCVRDIVKCRLEFMALHAALRNFLYRACEQPEPYPKSAEQPRNPPSIRNLRNQILEALSRLLQPSDAKS